MPRRIDWRTIAFLAQKRRDDGLVLLAGVPRVRGMIDPANQSDPVVQAILRLLGALPLKWGQVDNDDMTAAEQEAFKLLTAAGLVERRFALRLSLLGHPVCVEAVITLTGEYGVVEAVEPVAGAAWEAWAEVYQRQTNEDTEPRPRFHCEKTDPEMARLTDQGQHALRDVRDGKEAMVLDFIYHRGPAFAGRAVPGEGRAERIRTTAVRPPSSLDVQVKNLPEVSGPLAAINETLNKMLEQRAAASQGEGVGESSSETLDFTGGPEPDPHDTRKAIWVGKRIYLGDDTQVSRLFWLLARPVGVARTLGEVQRAVDGMETDRDCRPDETKKAGQRVRKAISKLRAALREAELDRHVIIVPGGPREVPEYTMVSRFTH